MKLSQLLISLKNIIILVWWLIILVFFKIYNNFVFKNGESIIFILLIFILPVALYIYSLFYKRNLKRIKALKKGPFLNQIKEDIKNKKWDKEFITKLNYLIPNLIIENETNEITISNSDIIINFNEQGVYLNLVDTKIKYNFSYNSKTKNDAQYCYYNFKYYSTSYLYQMILDLLEILSLHKLRYFEKEDKYILLNQNDEIIYHSKKYFKNDNKYIKEKIIDLKK